VRLRGRLHGGGEVPVRPKYHRPVTEGYCVVATRGGELPEVNCQSVTKYHRKMSNVNSIRPDGGTSLRVLCEVRTAVQASRDGKSFANGGVGQRDNERVLKETVNERKAATSLLGGWRQNGRKRKRDKQGDLLGTTRRSWPQRPKNRPIGVRASVVAKKRVTSVEPRDVGRWKDEEQNNGRQTDASARKGYAADGDQPSAIDLAGTACLAGILVRAKNGTHLSETPLTGKPDAGNPPVRFGGRGEVNPSSLPLSDRHF